MLVSSITNKNEEPMKHHCHYIKSIIAKSTIAIFLATALFALSCTDEDLTRDAEMISGIDVENGTMFATTKADCFNFGLELIHLRGKVRYFGLDILQQPPAPRPLTGIPDVRVWLAEYPFTKKFNIRTNDDGLWEMYLIKPKGRDLDVSFAYEKDHYPPEIEALVFPETGLPEGWDKSVIKSNVHTIASADITDLAMQMPDELFLYAAKTQLETQITQLTGVAYALQNIAVATVGKTWASIYDPALPHGDEGAAVTIEPAPPSPLSGPIYFDETVTPNPTLTVTSIDGGVLFNNLLPGVQSITAVKAPFEYDTIQFAVVPGFKLYVASPPHSIQGSNTSGPGLP